MPTGLPAVNSLIHKLRLLPGCQTLCVVLQKQEQAVQRAFLFDNFKLQGGNQQMGLRNLFLNATVRFTSDYGGGGLT